MLLSGIAYLACGCLYMIRAEPESLVEDAQVLLRLPLQIFCYLLSTVLFSRHIGLDNMGLCSPFFEGYSSLEALLIYLLWMASCVVVVVVVVAAGVGRVGVRSSFPSPLTPHPSPLPLPLSTTARYPTIASIPLKYSVVIQPILFALVQEPSRRECLMGGDCAKTDEMYDLYASAVAGTLPSMVPMTAGKAVRTLAGGDPNHQCLAMMFFWKLLIVVFLSWYITHFFEVRVRRLYVVQLRKGAALLDQINSKRVGGVQLFMETLLCMGLTWLVTQLCVID